MDALTEIVATRIVIDAQDALRDLNKLELILLARFGSGRPDERLREDAEQAMAAAGGHAARLRSVVEHFPGKSANLEPLIARLDDLHDQFDEIERAVDRRT